MSLAEFLAVLVTPVVFLGWGVLLGMPAAERPRDPADAWWQSPPVLGGIAAVAMALFTASALDDAGDVAVQVVLPAVLFLAAGWAFALRWRRRPIRSRDS